jgi:hypothetical protein
MPEPTKPAASVHPDASKSENVQSEASTSQSHEQTMSPEDAAELEAYRAERRRKEEAAKSAVNEDGTPNLNLDPRSEAFKSLSVDNQIRAHYLHARGTIQDYARLFHMTVPQVLALLDLKDVGTVQTIGDQIDQAEAGSEVVINPLGKRYDVPFDLS